MPKLTQVAFTAGEISPSLHARVDLARFLSALKTCRNFFVRPQGGASNRQGTQFIYELNAASNARLIPFIRAQDDAYMLVLQELSAKVFRGGAYVSSTVRTITNITLISLLGPNALYEVTTSVAHGFIVGGSVAIAGVNPSDYDGDVVITATPGANTFRYVGTAIAAPYVSGGTATGALSVVTPYDSDELAAIRYTQSADVMTLVHQGHYPAEITRTDATSFSFATITDIDTGPFDDLNTSATTMTASAATGSGITLTASTSVFTANHVGALVYLQMEDLSTVLPWEPSKLVSAAAVDPDGTLRISNGKVYIAAGNAVAPAGGTFTGTIAPKHSEGIEADGDLGVLNGVANSRAGIYWQYLHSLYGVARITAQAGTTATADVLSYIPVVSPQTTVNWAFGAWSEAEGYPGIVTYFADRLVFARSIENPQTQWASKTGDYHNFAVSNPQVDDDPITQTLNTRQTNAIVEMVPLEQLVSLTANSSWASPGRGEDWSPQTVGFFPQSYYGAADMRSVIVGESAIFTEKGARQLRKLEFAFDRDKFGGDELTILARHLFEDATIVDMDYAKDPHGILWIVLSDGTLAGLTYLPEQEVVAFHRHDTSGFFENVCVIPEDGRDAVYFVVRRTINGSTVRYLERLANRTNDSLDAMFVDCALSYDGRNTTATTITATGASYDGGDTVTLNASASIFASTDVGDAIQFDSVHVIITAYTSATLVSGELQSPLGAALQAVAITEWAFARDTFSGLAHVEGELITGLADGAAIDPDDTTTAGIVTGGQIVLAYPAAIVHIGLAYEQEIETLTLNVPGGAQIRDNAKIVPKVSVVIEETAGLQVSRDRENYEELTSRSFEFYTEPQELHTGVVTGYIVDTLDKDSGITLRQPVPKPANILAVLPIVTVGNNG